MGTSGRKSARAIAPGRIVARELESRDWTIETLATGSGLSIETIKDIVSGSRPITDEVANGLARAFASSADLWKNLESHYQRHLLASDR